MGNKLKRMKRPTLVLLDIKIVFLILIFKYFSLRKKSTQLDRLTHKVTPALTLSASIPAQEKAVTKTKKKRDSK